MNYEKALALSLKAREQVTEDEHHIYMMLQVLQEIESIAKTGAFQYECRFMVGNKGVQELRDLGFKVSYDTYNEVIKVKWFPRGQ